MFDRRAWSKEYNKKYYLEHRGGIIERAAKWNQEHKERRNKTCLESYYRRKTMVLIQQEGAHIKLKKEVLSQYSYEDSPSCSVCNENRLPCLSIDHINDDGAEHRRSLKSGANFYRWLKREGYPKGYQTLCMNCQFMKEYQRRQRSKDVSSD